MVKIFHLADIHIKNHKLHSEFSTIRDKFIEHLEEERPDYIFIVGDLFHSKSHISAEAFDELSYFLRQIRNYSNAPIHIITGNHDTALSNNDRLDSITPVVNAIGDVASSFFGVNLPPLAGLLTSVELQNNSKLSIEYDLSFYRSLLLPNYEDGDLLNSPPLVVLYFAESLLDNSDISGTPVPGDMISSTTPLWVLTNLKTKITKFLPNIKPMEAIVSFQFTQYLIANSKQQGVVGGGGSPLTQFQ